MSDQRVSRGTETGTETGTLKLRLEKSNGKMGKVNDIRSQDIEKIDKKNIL